jgi:hypothetical protein
LQNHFVSALPILLFDALFHLAFWYVVQAIYLWISWNSLSFLQSSFLPMLSEQLSEPMPFILPIMLFSTLLLSLVLQVASWLCV